MPIYEYTCPECQTPREELQNLGEDGRELECEECGHEGLERQFSTFAASCGNGSSSSAAAPSGGCGAPSGFT